MADDIAVKSALQRGDCAETIIKRAFVPASCGFTSINPKFLNDNVALGSEAVQILEGDIIVADGIAFKRTFRRGDCAETKIKCMFCLANCIFYRSGNTFFGWKSCFGDQRR